MWLPKTRFSAFFRTPLDSVLRRLGTRTVVICGVQTPNCIRGTAWDAIGARACTRARTHNHARTRARANTRVQTRRRAHAHMHAGTRTHARRHTFARARSRTRSHTRTAYDYDVVVLSDATASCDVRTQEANLRDMEAVGVHCPTWEGWKPA